MSASFAVVGSGPSGMYAADALLKEVPGCRVDVFDRLPTPYGLVRGGVVHDRFGLSGASNRRGGQLQRGVPAERNHAMDHFR